VEREFVAMKTRWFMLVAFFISITACSAKPTINTAELAEITTVTSNKSAIVGQLVSYTNHEPVPNTVIRLCQVYWDSEHKNASFVLEGATSPGAITDENGIFIINDVIPNEYVILIGDITGNYDIVKEDADTAKIFLLSPDNVLDVGVLEANLISN